MILDALGVLERRTSNRDRHTQQLDSAEIEVKTGEVRRAPAAPKHRPPIDPADVATIGSRKACLEKTDEREL